MPEIISSRCSLVILIVFSFLIHYILFFKINLLRTWEEISSQQLQGLIIQRGDFPMVNKKFYTLEDLPYAFNALEPYISEAHSGCTMTSITPHT